MNKLFLNSDKTHLLIMTSASKHRKYENFGINLNTGAEIIPPSYSERLLGAQVSNNFTWNEHIRDNEKSMLKMITSRVNAADFKTRKMIANAVVMSRLVYLVQVYGNAAEFLLKFLQVIQNKAARCVTRLRWGTETSVLLNQVGWLSVKQLIVFHSLVQLFKIKETGKPATLRLKFRDSFAYKTRNPKSDKSKDAFVYKSTVLWNNLPPEIRKIQKLDKLKIELKKWVKLNTGI